MATPTKNILILGATGLIGLSITSAILSSKSSFSSITIFTSPNTRTTKSALISHFQSQGARIITGDLTSASDITSAYTGIDTVVSCVGRPVIHLQLDLIQLADQHPDVRRFFPSEYGTDIEYSPASASEKPHQQKLKVRALLASPSIRKLEYTYVVTGPYADAGNMLYLDAKPDGQESEGSFNVARKRAVLLGDGNGKVSMTTTRDVGRLVVGALLHPDAVRNRAVRVNSFTATPREVLEEFERQTGGGRWEVSYTSLGELRELEERVWREGAPRAGSVTLRRIWTEGGTLYAQRENGVVGMEEGMDSLEDAVKRAVAVQRVEEGS